MKSVGILHYPDVFEVQAKASEIETWLSGFGIEAWTAPTWGHVSPKERLACCDLLIVLGGDGSILQAARIAEPFGIPILGVNFGRVGFLSEAQPDNWLQKLEKVLAGEYWIEQRLMIRADLERNGRILDTFTALNDVVVGRGRQARVIKLHLRVDNDLVTTYTADGLIVATPTGSTAYAMAAGGPLLPPQLQNFVVVPVAAHLTLNRALVLHEEAQISIRVEMRHEATLSTDGQQGVDLNNGDRILVKRHERDSYFVRFASSGYFYRRLMGRLGFGKWHV